MKNVKNGAGFFRRNDLGTQFSSSFFFNFKVEDEEKDTTPKLSNESGSESDSSSDESVKSNEVLNL